MERAYSSIEPCTRVPWHKKVLYSAHTFPKMKGQPTTLFIRVLLASYVYTQQQCKFLRSRLGSEELSQLFLGLCVGYLSDGLDSYE
jgi:hypothetical protein